MGYVGKISIAISYSANASLILLLFNNELPFEDLTFAIYDDVSQAIASNLLATLSPQEITEVKSNRPSNTEAYEYYMKGLHFHTNFWSTFSVDDINTSEQMLRKAIELDPNYAPAYAALADLYNSYFHQIMLFHNDHITPSYLKDNFVYVDHEKLSYGLVLWLLWLRLFSDLLSTVVS